MSNKNIKFFDWIPQEYGEKLCTMEIVDNDINIEIVLGHISLTVLFGFIPWVYSWPNLNEKHVINFSSKIVFNFKYNREINRKFYNENIKKINLLKITNKYISINFLNIEITKILPLNKSNLIEFDGKDIIINRMKNVGNI